MRKRAVPVPKDLRVCGLNTHSMQAGGWLCLYEVSQQNLAMLRLIAGKAMRKTRLYDELPAYVRGALEPYLPSCEGKIWKVLVALYYKSHWDVNHEWDSEEESTFVELSALYELGAGKGYGVAYGPPVDLSSLDEGARAHVMSWLRS